MEAVYNVAEASHNNKAVYKIDREDVKNICDRNDICNVGKALTYGEVRSLDNLCDLVHVRVSRRRFRRTIITFIVKAYGPAAQNETDGRETW